MASKQRLPDPATREELIELLRVESQKQRCTQKWTIGILCAMMAIIAISMLLKWVRSGVFPDDMLSTFGIFSCFGGFGAAASSSYKRALQLAAADDDPVMLGYLLEATTLPETSVANMAKDSVLPRLSKVDQPMKLTSEQIVALNQLITRHGSKREMQVAAIGATRFLGDSRSIQVLESIVERPSSKAENTHESQIKDLARLALIDLRMRLAKTIIDQKVQAVQDERSTLSQNVFGENADSATVNQTVG
jgi:hypothetical protein